MTYAALTTAKNKHTSAAQIIRYAGFAAKCVKNTLCDQPYQVEVKTTEEVVKGLQIQMEGLFIYPINVVAV